MQIQIIGTVGLLIKHQLAVFASRLIPLYIHVRFRPFFLFPLVDMLTLRPQPPPTRFPDHKMYQRRGRSRQVSHAALARQASEERRTPRSQPLPQRRSPVTSERQQANPELLPVNNMQLRELQSVLYASLVQSIIDVPSPHQIYP
jgi:hypothetical protein